MITSLICRRTRKIILCTPSSSSSVLLYHTCIRGEDPQLKEANKWKKQQGAPMTSHSFSSTSSSPPSSSWRHHHDEETRIVKVAVWWDFENCNVPSGVNVFKIAQRITTALRSNGIKGPITISAFGDFLQISRFNQEALSMTGITLNHVPRGGKNSADRSLLVDLMCWVSQNPPPAHLFLISGDKDFASVLHRLRMSNYNILLASTEPAPGVLCNAASIMWYWNHLVRGANTSCKHFGQPPDGPYGSWYGYYKGPLDDPFSETVQLAYSQQAEDSSDPGIDSNPRPIPKVLVNRIRHILNLNPKGIHISELRTELGRSNITMDKEFFGYKKFSLLLKSLSSILSIQVEKDGQITVHGTQPKVTELADTNARLDTGVESNSNTVNGDNYANAELHATNNAVTTTGENLSSSSNSSAKELPSLGSESPNSVTKMSEKSSSPSYSPPEKELPPISPSEIDAKPTEDHSTPVEQHGSISEAGFFRRLWRTWFAGESGASCKNSDSSLEECSVSEHSTKEKKTEEIPVDSMSSASDSSVLSSSSDSSVLSSSSDTTELAVKEKSKMTFEENDDKSNSSVGLFSKIVNWCGLSKSGRDPTNTSIQCGDEVNRLNIHKEDDLFSSEAFWNDIRAFLHTPKGSALISKSRNRIHMWEKLQKEGPLVLRNLSKNDLARVVNILITEKEWVEENWFKNNFFQNFPYKVVPSCGAPSSSELSGSKSVGSMFLDTSSQTDSKRQLDHEKGNESGNNIVVGASLAKSSKRTSKSNSEMLADCQKLVAEILEKHPEGFNMALFRVLFLQRFGYALGYRSLGFQKLAALLQTMPGVQIEQSFILPAGRAPKAKSDFPYVVESDRTSNVSSSESESKGKDDQNNFLMELGPITVESSSSNNSELEGSGKIKKMDSVNYEDPSYFSDEFSESDEVSPVNDRPTGKKSDEDSSLLQILNSFYPKDDKVSVYTSNDKDEIVCSKNDLKCSLAVKADNSTIASLSNQPKKNYSFVRDTDGDEKEKIDGDEKQKLDGDEKEKLVDNILDTFKRSTESSKMKKSSKSRMQA